MRLPSARTLAYAFVGMIVILIVIASTPRSFWPWPIVFLIAYGLIGFACYQGCKFLADKVIFFDLVGDLFGLRNVRVTKTVLAFWLIGWVVITPVYLLLSTFILFISVLAACLLACWVKVFPNHRPNGL